MPQHWSRKLTIVAASAICLAGLTTPRVVQASVSSSPKGTPAGHPRIMNQAATRLAAPPSRAAAPRHLSPSAPRQSAAPATTARPQRQVFGFAQANEFGANTGIGYNTWNFSLLSTVAYFGLDVDGNGNLIQNDSGWAGWQSPDMTAMIARAHSYGTRVVITLVQHDDSNHSLCTALQNQSRTVTQVVNQVNAKGVDGVNVDYESGNYSCGGTDIRHRMTSFVQDLRSKLPPGHNYLTVDTYSSSASDPGGMFDVAAMATSVDQFFVMAYDMDNSNYKFPPLNCSSYCFSPVAPLSGYQYNDTTSASQYVQAVGASKVILGVPYYGWTACVAPLGAGRPGSNATPQSSAQWLNPSYLDSSTTNDSTPGVTNFATGRDQHDLAGQVPYSTWQSSSHNCWREMYWDDVSSLGLKYNLVNRDNLAGVGIWTLGMGGGAPELWSALATHFAYIPGAPTGVSACPGEGFATVNWSPAPSAGGPITAYTVTAYQNGNPVTSVTVSGKSGFAAVPGLTNGVSYSFAVTASNAYGAGVTSAFSNAVTPSAPTSGTWPGAYVPLTPYRALDTRPSSHVGPGGLTTLGPGQTLQLPVLGVGGVPSSGVSAVVANITVAKATASGYITAFGAGSCRPYTSTVDFASGQIVPNLAEVSLGANGAISIYNALGDTDVLVDLMGYVPDASASAGRALFTPKPPTRLLDTRANSHVGPANLVTMGPKSTINLPVAGTQGIPSNATAVALNVTATNTTQGSYLTAYPAGAAQPGTSNLNWAPGQNVPNRVIVGLGPQGAISLYNDLGRTDVVVDLAGWFGPSGSTSYTGSTPVRILDTRDGTGGVSSPVGPGGTISLQVTGTPGVPASGVKAVVLNVTVTNTTQFSYLTVYPDGSSRPVASDLNWSPGWTRANLVVVQVPGDGRVDIYNNQGSTDVVVDVVGWYG